MSVSLSKWPSKGTRDSNHSSRRPVSTSTLEGERHPPPWWARPWLGSGTYNALRALRPMAHGWPFEPSVDSPERRDERGLGLCCLLVSMANEGGEYLSEISKDDEHPSSPCRRTRSLDGKYAAPLQLLLSWRRVATTPARCSPLEKRRSIQARRVSSLSIQVEVRAIPPCAAIMTSTHLRYPRLYVLAAVMPDVSDVTSATMARRPPTWPAFVL